ncbi:MAG TPA: NnrS family protein, partial [Nitrosospira sp.]
MSVWRYLAAAPHRAMFLAGALQGVLTLLWWVFDLSGRYGFTGTAPAWGIAPVWAHAFLMIYGFFPFFICGFLFTTFPNWMNGEKIHPRYYVSACLLMSAGVALFYLGLAMGESLMAAGVAVLLAGFSIAVYALLHVLIRVKEKDREQDTRHGTAATGGL